MLLDLDFNANFFTFVDALNLLQLRSDACYRKTERKNKSLMVYPERTLHNIYSECKNTRSRCDSTSTVDVTYSVCDNTSTVCVTAPLL